MADLSVVKAPVDGGVDLGAVAVPADVAGDTVPVGPNRFLYVANGDASQHTATVATSRQVSGLDVADAVLTVPAGSAGVIPLPSRPFGGSDGRASVSYDAVTSVTVAVLELGR